MARVRALTRFIDPFLLLLMTTVGLAALFPVGGGAQEVVDGATKVFIGLLFFLYGARLSTRDALDGVRHWRLHLTILGCTFLVFPLLGLAARGLVPWLITDDLYTGLLFLCLVPSTVQSSIAFTSIARGNVAGAIAAGSFSSIAGIVLTPLLAAAFIGASAGISADSLLSIGGQLLLPFLAGQLLRRWIGGFITRHRLLVMTVDRGSILVVVYAAFSEGMNENIWSEASWGRLLALLAVEGVLLTVMLVLTTRGAGRLGFGRGDRIAITFAGSKKSLAAGLPMAGVIFPEQTALAVLPLMLFHQLQLLVCAFLARRWSAEAPGEPDGPGERGGPGGPSGPGGSGGPDGQDGPGGPDTSGGSSSRSAPA
ncbi:bile acid:sodium symporter [Streptomyces sp. XM4011]|uniref:bile acid:sodium symporter family protein n=1 Tax=Streptomyces sp. XM4011 TaxID=2929780 RepID=UPI001FFBF93C|nr:bile acid:sodium symporter family protein [Streptomyces sp. XM4011]MCK1817060.1 bile acid:sodium symporter [Streptomyces sp. XM4011]